MKHEIPLDEAKSFSDDPFAGFPATARRGLVLEYQSTYRR